MARLAPVKCLYCGESFRREETEYVQVSAKRYAHKTCAENQGQIEIIKQQTFELASKWLGDSLNIGKYNIQYRHFIKEGKTPEEIYQALKYWVEVRQGGPEKANGGIAILDYVFGEAYQYYKNQAENKKLNKDIDYQVVKQNLSDSIKLTIKPTPIAKPKRLKFFKLN